MNKTFGLRWGILGCARISRRGLIPGIQGSQTGRLAALASRNPETARAWAAEFAIPRVHGSYESLLADPEIDVVYLPLPNELHGHWTRAAADAGKHVLCEKPLARNGAEARAMAAYCRERGVLLMEAFMWRHQARMQAIYDLVRNNTLGELRYIHASFSFVIDPADWRLDPDRGGGALYDVGCYGVNAARFFTGAEPNRVQTQIHRSSTGTDHTLATQMLFPGGVLAQVDCSFELPFRCRLELAGTQGCLNVADAFISAQPPQATLLRLGTDSTPATPELLTFEPNDPYAAMVDHFDACIRAGRLLAPAEDGVRQMEALDAVLRAVD